MPHAIHPPRRLQHDRLTLMIEHSVPLGEAASAEQVADILPVNVGPPDLSQMRVLKECDLLLILLSSGGAVPGHSYDRE